jgi:hypothetical protein
MVYTPEVGVHLDTLRDDVKFLKRRYALDEKGKSEGRLVIKCASRYLIEFFITDTRSSETSPRRPSTPST